MDLLKWKIYKFLLAVILVLSVAGVVLYWYSVVVLPLPFKTENLVLVIATFFIILHAIYFLQAVSSRLPNKGLNSVIEGFAYTLNLLISIGSVYILFYATVFLNAFIDRYQPGFVLYKSPLFISMVLYLLLGILVILSLIFSIQLLSLLNKNRKTVLRQISSIGKE